jgi:hypothetical protein
MVCLQDEVHERFRQGGAFRIFLEIEPVNVNECTWGVILMLVGVLC